MPISPTNPETSLRFRLWIDGILADETWIDGADPDVRAQSDTAAHRMRERADAADAAGGVWLLEVFNPTAPADAAYLRIGSDVAGMAAPVEPSITCPRCGRTSHHPADVVAGYCGACHDWTSPPRPAPAPGADWRV
jgi:ribosomal protein L37E